MLAETVEVGAKPRAHGGLAVIAWLRDYDMQDGDVNARMEVLVAYPELSRRFLRQGAHIFRGDFRAVLL